ncbi:hypothetical protein [Dyadobacter luticola]|uniref:Uncharacterized protein n=1 Tax=Dyadobacter luticola TaxID=1979387 RepID=A0A5R9KVQ2_9BACT|nr:hypothetical protein [Dyadobacter luticola]TLV00352.1 hypothetical protein FEN17_12715 [Dyadobacter luticola]
MNYISELLTVGELIIVILVSASLYILLQKRSTKKKRKKYDPSKYDYYDDEKGEVSVRRTVKEEMLAKENARLYELLMGNLNIYAKHQGVFNLDNRQIAVQTIYISYDKLNMEGLSRFLLAYDYIFKSVYQLAVEHQARLPIAFDEYPEDAILEILSAHTGNSIIIKVKTGWMPEIALQNGNFEVSLPKGAIVLIFVGILIKGAITWGLENYKSIQEIEANSLENEKLRIELNELRAKYEKELAMGRAEHIKDTLSEIKLFEKSKDIRSVQFFPPLPMK